MAAGAASYAGAPTVRAYGVRARTAARIDGAIDRHYRASVEAQKVTAAVFVTGEFVAAVANAAVVVVGVLLGLAGEISAGTLVAFLFLVTLFVAPVQTASEVLNEAQNAVAGFRRVLDVIDTDELIAASRLGLITDDEAEHALKTTYAAVDGLAANGYELGRWLSTMELSWRRH